MAREPRLIRLAVARAVAVVFALAALTYFVVSAQAGSGEPAAGPGPEKPDAAAAGDVRPGAAAAQAMSPAPIPVRPQYLPSSKSMVMPASAAVDAEAEASSEASSETSKGGQETPGAAQPARTEPYLWSSKSGVIRRPGS